MSRNVPKNTLQQDLALVAKNHYDAPLLFKSQQARLVCAYHVLMEASHMKMKHVAGWLLKEFVEPGVILKEREQLARFMLEHGKYNVNIFGNVDSAPPGTAYIESYFDLLVEDLLAEVMRTQVYKDGEYLLSFPWAPVDPDLLNYLRQQSAKEPADVVS